MIRNTLTSLALVAGCTIALAVPAAQAQTIDTQVLMNAPRVNPGDRTGWMAGDNNLESAQYERLMQNSPAFRQSRMQKECGPITDLQLRLNCIDSLGAADDERGLEPQEGLTGGSMGTMNSTGAPPYSPNRPIPNAGR